MSFTGMKAITPGCSGLSSLKKINAPRGFSRSIPRVYSEDPIRTRPDICPNPAASMRCSTSSKCSLTLAMETTTPGAMSISVCANKFAGWLANNKPSKIACIDNKNLFTLMLQSLNQNQSELFEPTWLLLVKWVQTDLRHLDQNKILAGFRLDAIAIAH